MTAASFPLDVQPLEDELTRQLLADFTGEREGYVQVGPDKWFLPVKYLEHASKYLNFEVRPDDIWVVTYARSGTTLTQEMVWLIANDMNLERAKSVPLMQRFPFLEFNMLFHDEVKAELLARNHGDSRKTEIVEELSRPGYEILNETPGPRFIKSHFPLSLLPANLLDTCKVIYVARNPKDVAVSFYHQNRLIGVHGFIENFEKYWDYFEKNLRPWTPFWKHLQEGWERRNHPNLKFLFYEDMIKNQASVIRDLAHFLGKRISEEQVTQLIEHLDIANFRHNPAVNFDQAKEIGMLREGVQNFVRKGKTGGWREEFTPELNVRADKWIEENLKNTDLRFPST